MTYFTILFPLAIAVCPGKLPVTNQTYHCTIVSARVDQSLVGRTMDCRRLAAPLNWDCTHMSKARRRPTIRLKPGARIELRM